MGDFNKIAEEIRRLVEPLFNEDLAPHISNFELGGLRGNLTYLVGNANTSGLQLIADSVQGERERIQSLLKEVNELANESFQKIEDLLPNSPLIAPQRKEIDQPSTSVREEHEEPMLGNPNLGGK